MDHLSERLRVALAPHYQVAEQLGTGGMGVVYRGYDPALKRPVAIKLLKPELATAVQASRFIREARILAKLSHPNVVTVFQAGESAGLFYYVMEYAASETLADRLTASPLDADSLDRVAGDLLAGLGAAHDLGVVHRDLKPANVLLRTDRAMIGDFGIALAEPTTTETEDAAAPPSAGTPAYMAPEQALGKPATKQSDIYALGMVLYEAATGQRWTTGTAPERGDWRAVPKGFRRPLQRALAPAPGDRWPTAGAMARALGRRRRLWIPTAAAAVVAVAAAAVWWPRPLPPIGVMQVHLARADGQAPWIDSVTDAIRIRFARNTDFGLVSDDAAPVLIDPAVSGDPFTIHLTATIRGRRLPTPVLVETDPVPRGEWRAAADQLADRVVFALYRGEADIDPWLPRGALPRTAAGLQAWYRAERAFGFAQYEEAFLLYLEAEALDSTCLLCLYRLNDIDRWLARTPAAERLRKLVAHQNAFPPHYAALIRAYALTGPGRYDSLLAAARDFRDFALGWFAAGDEAFHRGAIHGRPRSEAIDHLIRATRLKPGFAPAWEHLAWASLAAGDSLQARIALDSLARAPAGGGFPIGLRQLLNLAFWWRFLPEERAAAETDRILANPAIWNLPDVAAGARTLPTMGSPSGAVYLGQRFAAQTGRADIVRNGLWAELFGSSAMGNEAAVAAARDRLLREDASAGLSLFLSEWDAVRGLIEDGTLSDSARRRLTTAHHEAALDSPERERSGWMLDLLGGAPSGTIEPARADLRALLEAKRMATAGDPVRALAHTGALHPWEPGPPADPFLPLLLRWLRADWLEAVGRPGAAARELAGYQHLQLNGLPVNEPQAGEIDWAFGPSQAWRRARLLASEPRPTAELCAALRDVAWYWGRGTGAARARADSARTLLTRHRCDSGR